MDSQDRYERLREVFDRVVELSANERAAALDQACEGDPGLRDQVESLLAAEEREPAWDSIRVSVPPKTGTRGEQEDRAGAEIGSYRLVRRIGEGGMGVVWEAEQLQPVRRRVALKLVKWGMDTERVVARFEAERQTLAHMTHRAIARVFDAGATDRGRPYFVMEYVEGVPITTYCDTKRLDLDQRIELFLRVCDGVLHAHRKGVLHRDLKPANLLIAEEEGRPVPKIIDFGIAKVTDQNLTERMLTRELGRIIGTPEYMSPEQAGDTETEVDTRTDIYSLGVILYELLAGALPRDWSRTSSLDDVRQRLASEPTPRPSRRLITLPPDARRPIAERRRLEAGQLSRALSRDLDWIVLRALEREPDRRYGTVDELAQDLGRYLEHRPVSAGPPSATYRTRKFVRRHRFAVIAGAAVVLALAIGFAATWVALLHARDAEAVAQREAATAKRVTTFLTDLFQASNPWQHVRGEAPGLDDILESAIAELEQGTVDDPGVGARLSRELASVAVGLDRRKDARRLLDTANGHLDGLGPSFDAERAEVFYVEAELALSEWDLDAAERFSDRAREAFERSRGRMDPAYGRYLIQRGRVAGSRRRWDEAQRWYRRAVERLESAPPTDLRDLGTALANLATSIKEPDERCALARRAIDVRRRAYTGDHPHLAESLRALASCEVARGDYEEAARHYDDSHAMYARALGPGSPATLQALDLLVVAEYFLGRYESLARRLEEGLSALGNELDRPFEAGLMHNMLATVCVADGNFEPCRESSRRAIRLFESAGDFGVSAAWVARHTLADLEFDAGRSTIAGRMYREIADYRQATGPDDDYWLPYIFDSWARVEAAGGDLVRARELAGRAVADYDDLIWEPRYRARAWMTLATVEAMDGRTEEAETARERALEEYARVRGPATIHDLRAEAAWFAVREEAARAAAVARALLDRGVARSVLLADPWLSGLPESLTADAGPARSGDD